MRTVEQHEAEYHGIPVPFPDYSAVRPVSVGVDTWGVETAITVILQWLEAVHGCTFSIATPIRVNAQQDYDAIKAAILTTRRLDIPTFAYAPGPNIMPGSYSDPEMLAVKETLDLGIVAHELAHLWTDTGAEAHYVTITDSNPYDNAVPNPSILGQGQFTFPNAQLAPEHLEKALSLGYIRRIR